MAIVQDLLTTVQARTVFIKPPDQVRQFGPLPRAVVNFHLDDGTISAKPLNDTYEMQISIVLDPQFAYRMVDIVWFAAQDVANDWNAAPYLEIFEGIRGLAAGATMRHRQVRENSFQTPSATEMGIVRKISGTLPQYIIQKAGGTGAPVVNFHATNQAAAAGAVGVVNALFSFLEYDIEQVEHFPLHYPELVLQR